jgi:hypothetical protein
MSTRRQRLRGDASFGRPGGPTLVVERAEASICWGKRDDRRTMARKIYGDEIRRQAVDLYESPG